MPSKYGLDPGTDLGFALQQPIPTGPDFEPWAFKVKGPKKTPYAKLTGLPCVFTALRDAGYELAEIQLAFAALSHYRWAPSGELLQSLVQR